MPPSCEEGEMWIAPCLVASHAYRWFRDVGEWPNVGEFHQHLAQHFRCPTEVAAFDVHNALERGEVYGLPSIVAMRLGEAVGNWTDGPAALQPGDNGHRIAVTGTTGLGAPGSDFQSFDFMYRLGKRLSGEVTA